MQCQVLALEFSVVLCSARDTIHPDVISGLQAPLPEMPRIIPAQQRQRQQRQGAQFLEAADAAPLLQDTLEKRQPAKQRPMSNMIIQLVVLVAAGLWAACALVRAHLSLESHQAAVACMSSFMCHSVGAHSTCMPPQSATGPQTPCA